MKTAAEFIKLFGWGDEITMTSLTALIEARDAEHRAEIERLKGELAEARVVVKECRDVMVIQTKRSTGEFHLSSDAFLPMWGNAITAATKCLAVPPPAESTPVPMRCTASAGSCNSPVACGEAGRCIDARMREVAGAPPDDIRARLERLESEVRYLADTSTQGAMVTLENKVAALEAKGEPGTFDHEYVNDGKKRCEVCGLRENEGGHPKGAKP